MTTPTTSDQPRSEDNPGGYDIKMKLEIEVPALGAADTTAYAERLAHLPMDQQLANIVNQLAKSIIPALIDGVDVHETRDFPQ